MYENGGLIWNKGNIFPTLHSLWDSLASDPPLTRVKVKKAAVALFRYTKEDFTNWTPGAAYSLVIGLFDREI